jgi:hypothetical protein
VGVVFFEEKTFALILTHPHPHPRTHVAQCVRRYEGTTGIQALDLLGRKILLGGGKAHRKFMFDVLGYCKKQIIDKRATSQHKREAATLAAYTLKWGAATVGLALQARTNKDVVSSASVDFMMYSGYVSMAYFWLKMMDIAQEKLKTVPASESAFYSVIVFLWGVGVCVVCFFLIAPLPRIFRARSRRASFTLRSCSRVPTATSPQWPTTSRSCV